MNIHHNKFELLTSQHIDVYEHVNMFLCVLARGKGCRQSQTLFNHSLETIEHYFKLVLQAVLEFSRLIIRLDLNYNHGVEHHIPDQNEHSLFKDCIGTIDGTHVKVVLPQD